MSGLRLIGVGRRGAGDEAGRLACGPFSAWVAEEDDSASLNGVKRHHRSVLAAQTAGAFAPAPYGRAYPSEDALRAFVSARAPQLDAALTRVQTHEEWGLRCSPIALRESAATGSAYLRGRQQARRALDAAFAGIEAFCVGVAETGAADQCRALRRRDDEIAFALLIGREARQQSLDATQALALRLFPGFTARLSGPWPLYSFSCLREDPDGAC